MSRRRVDLNPVSVERFDKLLSSAWDDLSRTRIQDLMRAGHVSLDGVVVRDASLRIGAAAVAELDEPPAVAPEPRPEAIPLAIMFEDDHLIVLDKPAGLVVHPAAGHETGTLVNALIAHCGEGLSGIGGVKRPGIVHRLDKDTSGLLVVAKTDAAHRSLSMQFADHGRTGDLARTYSAFVWGVPEPERGRIDLPIARHPTRRDRMGVARPDTGRHAGTKYVVEQVFGANARLASLVSCTLETGRTHQIRVHLAHLRHPLIGDATYGSGFRTQAARLNDEARGAVERLCRQALHAGLLQFAHPVTTRIMRFESGLPADLTELRRLLEAV